MIKSFARWLFMKTHRNELIEIAQTVRNTEFRNLPAGEGLRVCGKLDGTLETLEKLDLLV